MKTFLSLTFLVLVGCAVPPNEPSFVAEKTPAAAALAGEPAKEGDLSDQIKAANEKNNDRLLKGDWRAAKPAVGPAP
jgi:hypothetical protein